MESATQILQRGKAHQEDEQRPERDHEMERVVKKLQVVQPLFSNVRLPNESNPRHWSAFELPFHRSERDRLMMTNHLGLCVAGWKGNEKRCDQPTNVPARR